MSNLTILSKDERRKFDKIPALSREARQRYFRVDRKANAALSTLTTPLSKIGYVLQLGYFNAVAKFYPVSEFKKRDVNYVRRLPGYKDSITLDFSRYTPATYYRHQKKIQSSLRWREFDEQAQDILLDEAVRQAGLQRKPKRIFWHLIDCCWKHQLTIPGYTELAEIVTQGFLDFEESMLSRLAVHIDEDFRVILDNIIDHVENVNTPRPILALKRINHSLKPRHLAQSTAIANNSGDLFARFGPLMEQLQLSDQAAEYYATWVQKARPNQLSGMVNRDKAYLHTLAFCQHQYYSRQDALMIAFLKCVAHSFTRARNQLNQHELTTRKSRNQAIKAVVKNHRSQRELLHSIRQVSKQAHVMPSEKYYKIEALIAEFDEQHNDSEASLPGSLEKQLLDGASEEKLYAIMTDLSRT